MTTMIAVAMRRMNFWLLFHVSTTPSTVSRRRAGCTVAAICRRRGVNCGDGLPLRRTTIVDMRPLPGRPGWKTRGDGGCCDGPFGTVKSVENAGTTPTISYQGLFVTSPSYDAP